MPHSGRSVNSTQYRQTQNEVGGSPAGVMESKQIWWKMEQLQVRASLGCTRRSLMPRATLKVGPGSERLQIVSFIPAPQRPAARTAAGRRRAPQRFLGAQGYRLRGGTRRSAEPGGPQRLR